MKKAQSGLTRRNSLKNSIAAGAVAVIYPACSQHKTSPRLHPLDGIARENIKITDITLTPLSYVDRDKDLWRSDSYTVWKTDAALTRVYTDQGTIGIGEGTPYGGGYRIDLLKKQIIEPLRTLSELDV